MSLSQDEVANLLRQLALTKDIEATCDECFQEMAEYAETVLAGNTLSEGLKMVRDHLDLCSECREEYEMLLAALRES